MALFTVGIDTPEDVLEIRRQVIEALANGALEITSWSSEGTTVVKTRGMSMRQILDETKLYLQEYDPDLYGRTIKRMSPYYYQ